jgi:hypothetical protein
MEHHRVGALLQLGRTVRAGWPLGTILKSWEMSELGHRIVVPLHEEIERTVVWCSARANYSARAN